MRFGSDLLASCVSCVVVFWTVACANPDTAGRNRAIETAIKPFGELAVTTGSRLNLGGDALAYLKKLEAAGLITIHEVPQDYWGGFATRTFMEGAKPYSVAATPQLLAMARDANLDGKAGGPSNNGASTRYLRVSDPKLGDILRDEEYKGPLATPGETHRLILARIKNASSLSQVGKFEFEFAGDEVDHGYEVTRGSVATSLGLGSLNEAVDSFEKPVSDLGCEPA